MKSKISEARAHAYDVFSKVIFEKQKPEVLLESVYQKHSEDLSKLDRAFMKELIYGSLRWYSKIFWILQKTSSRDLSKTPQCVQTALVVGTYQIFYLDRVPDRAAVNESVEYVRIRGQASAVSFVNGILRQIARRAEYFAKPDKETQKVEYLSLQFAHPRWMVDRWIQHFKFDKLEVMLAAHNQPPPYAIRLNALKTDPQNANELQQSLLKEEKTHSERRPLRICLRLKEAPRLEDGSLFSKGFYSIQDEAAQLVCYLVEPKEGDTIVDACAGPGGKLAQLFEQSQAKAKIIGIEKSKTKLLKIEQNLKRLHIEEGLTLVEGDFQEWKPAKASDTPDKILLDAPCSGLGVLRRHPEAKWHKQPTIISDCVKIQRNLLSHAIDLLSKKGGELTYSVCSFEREESIDQLHWLKDTYGEAIEQISCVSRLPDYYKRYVTRDNIMVVYSGNQDNMDGFSAFTVKIHPKKKN